MCVCVGGSIFVCIVGEPAKISPQMWFPWQMVGLLSMMEAAISAPIPNCGHPPSTVMTWWVFFTESTMAALSSGRMVRRLMTSQLTPFSSSSLAASRAAPTARETATRVRWEPGEEGGGRREEERGGERDEREERRAERRAERGNEEEEGGKGVWGRARGK